MKYLVTITTGYLLFLSGNVNGQTPKPWVPETVRRLDKPVYISPKKVVNTTQTVWSTRQPIGHTHTCANGHTWDHQANSGHTCLICGLSQYVQDSSPRMVTVRTSSNVPTYYYPQTTYLPQYTYTQGYTPQYTLGNSSNCVNGKCYIK